MTHQGNIYVAVVDDDESMCRSVARLFRTSGLHPVMYRCAEAFLADSKRPRFDCLVLDVQLIGMSGIELTRHLTALGSTIPVIFNTAFDEPEIRDEAMRSGCSAYLRKTDSGQTVLAAIFKAIHSMPEELAE